MEGTTQPSRIPCPKEKASLSVRIPRVEGFRWVCLLREPSFCGPTRGEIAGKQSSSKKNFKKYFRLIYPLLLILLLLAACAKQPDGLRFVYKLTQHAYRAELISRLTLQTQDNLVKFAVAFKGGGGSYDEARLEHLKDTVRVVLFDTDGKFQEMWVVYQLSGSLSGFGSGKYAFRIEDTDGRLIVKDSFIIE